MKNLIFALLIIATPITSLATELKTTVLSVVDGDTIIIKTNNGPKTVHARGYESPDPGQPFFDEAKQMLTKIIEGKPVKISINGKIDNDSVVRVTPTSHKNIPIVMIANGLGWADKRAEPVLRNMETKARMKQVGLWSEPNAEAPWAYRARYSRKSIVSARVGKTYKARNLGSDSAKDIPRDPDGTAVGKGGGFVFVNQGVHGSTEPYWESHSNYNDNHIKAACKGQWGNDYRMVKYCVNKQSSAKRYIRQNCHDTEVLKMCEGEWGHDWSMVKYCYGKQTAAKRYLEN